MPIPAPSLEALPLSPRAPRPCLSEAPSTQSGGRLSRHRVGQAGRGQPRVHSRELESFVLAGALGKGIPAARSQGGGSSPLRPREEELKQQKEVSRLSFREAGAMTWSFHRAGQGGLAAGLASVCGGVGGTVSVSSPHSGQGFRCPGICRGINAVTPKGALGTGEQFETRAGPPPHTHTCAGGSWAGGTPARGRCAERRNHQKSSSQYLYRA